MRHLVALAALAFTTACSGSDSDKKPADETPDPGVVADGCARDKLEADITYTPMSGPKVDAEGKLAAPGADGYVVSTTFLRLREGEQANARFQELLGPILAGFPTRPGMQAFQLALSSSCNTARTLSVWADADAMFEFVVSGEHQAAVNAVGEVSRGGSIVTHWDATTAEEASWDDAAKSLAAANGPYY